MKASIAGRDKGPAAPPRRAVAGRNEVLVQEYRRSQDSRILEKLIANNQGLLHAILRRFTYLADPYEDLLQVANLGLIKAIQRYDADRGVSLATFASAVIDGEVRHHLRDGVLMRQPRWLKKLEKQVDAASIELARELKRPPKLEEIAEAVNISEEGILEILKAAAVDLQCLDDVSLAEQTAGQIDTGRVHSLHYESFMLPVEDRIAVQQALVKLSTLHKKIVYLLFFRGLTQTEVAVEMGLNQRKVSRESNKALGKLKAVLNTKLF